MPHNSFPLRPSPSLPSPSSTSFPFFSSPFFLSPPPSLFPYLLTTPLTPIFSLTNLGTLRKYNQNSIPLLQAEAPFLELPRFIFLSAY